MNAEASTLEETAEFKNAPRRAEQEWNNLQSTSSFKNAFFDCARAKQNARMADVKTTGAEKTLSEATRIEIAFDHRERLKQVLWRNAPNCSFGIASRDAKKDKKGLKRTRDDNNPNQQPVKNPRVDSGTRSETLEETNKNLKAIAEGKR
jgi:hypothetical protein